VGGTATLAGVFAQFSAMLGIIGDEFYGAEYLVECEYMV
jgi:hypothetical protein